MSSSNRSSQRSAARNSGVITVFPEFPESDEDADEEQRLFNRSSARHSFFATGSLDLKKDNSLSIITSVWSTMMGSTVLVMPKLFRSAGLISSIISCVFMCLLCSYTAVTVTRLGQIHGMSTKEVLSVLPKPLRIGTLLASVAILLGACCLFHAYIVDCVLSLLGYSVSDDKQRMLVALGTGALVFCILIPRSLKILFIASSYGIIIIGICLIFIVVKSILELQQNDCPAKIGTSYGTGFGGFGPLASLMCTLTLSFYSHSFILPLVSQSTRMSKIPRNVFVAYVCAGISYMVPSAVSVVAFRMCSDFSGTFVGMFDDPFANVVRVAIIILVLVVYPIIVFISRTQLLEIFGREDADNSWSMHLGTNLGIVAGCTMLPLLNASPTAIAAMAGVFATYWSLILPCVGLFVTQRRSGTEISKASLVCHGLIIILAIALMITTILTVFEVIASAETLPPVLTTPPAFPTNTSSFAPDTTHAPTSSDI